MGLNIGSTPIYGVNAVQTKVVGDFVDLSCLNRETASQYEICVAVNRIVEELLDKSATNINYLEELDPEKASTGDISRSLNKILIYLKAQQL